jgi:type I restriction enzyme R subunit
MQALRQLSEAFAQYAAVQSKLMSRQEAAANQMDLLRVLEQHGIVRDQVAELFHVIRRHGNRAVHDFVGSRAEALDTLRLAYRLAVWFHATFRQPGFKAPPYLPPTDPTEKLRALEEEAARARAELGA